VVTYEGKKIGAEGAENFLGYVFFTKMHFLWSNLINFDYFKPLKHIPYTLLPLTTTPGAKDAGIFFTLVQRLTPGLW
jgi:hypothetical protein